MQPFGPRNNQNGQSTAPPPGIGQMLLRVIRGCPQSNSARTVEVFGWIDLTLGLLIFFVPEFMAGLLRLPELSLQTANYVRLVGLLVSGLGTLYVVSGRLNARGFVFASMLDRPVVPVRDGDSLVSRHPAGRARSRVLHNGLRRISLDIFGLAG